MPPKFFLTLFSCFALSLITIGVLSGGETDSSDKATLGSKIKEMAILVLDAMEAAGKEIDEALGEWGYSINTAIVAVLIILFLSVIIGVERRIYSRTGRFYSEFLSIESGGVDLEVTKDEFRKLSSYRPLSWIGGSYSKANNLLKDARMSLNDLLTVMDRMAYLRNQISEWQDDGFDVTSLEVLLMELETELAGISGRPMDFNSLEKIQQTWAKRDAERRELEKETGGFGWSSGNYTSMFGSPRNGLSSLVVIVLTFASLFLFIATFAEVCFETQYQSASAVCLGDTDSYRNFFYGSSNWPIVLVAGSSLSFFNALFITMLYGGPKALGDLGIGAKDQSIPAIAGKPKHSVNVGIFCGVFCLLMVVVMLELESWFFNLIGIFLLVSLDISSAPKTSAPKIMPNFSRIFSQPLEDRTIELALLFRFFVQLVIALMFISWGIAGYTRYASNPVRFLFWPFWSIFGLWMCYGAFTLGRVLVQRVGRDEAVYSLYEQNFKNTKDVSNKMWRRFNLICFLGSLIHILHHVPEDYDATVWYIYWPLGLIQFVMVAGLVFDESPIKYKRPKSFLLDDEATKTKPATVLTLIMWFAGFLMLILFLVFLNTEVDSPEEDEALNIFCISIVLFLIIGVAKLSEILKGRDAKHSKETKAESDPISFVAATPVFKLEQHTDKSIKEIEEEQHAMVSDMEDES